MDSDDVSLLKFAPDMIHTLRRLGWCDTMPTYVMIYPLTAGPAGDCILLNVILKGWISETLTSCPKCIFIYLCLCFFFPWRYEVTTWLLVYPFAFPCPSLLEFSAEWMEISYYNARGSASEKFLKCWLPGGEWEGGYLQFPMYSPLLKKSFKSIIIFLWLI